MNRQPDISEQILSYYRDLVGKKHPEKVDFWPVLSGHNVRVGGFGEHIILIFEHTGNSGMLTHMGLGLIPSGVIGFPEITDQNKPAVRAKLERHFHTKSTDSVLILHPRFPVDDELHKMLERHEFALGLVSMKVFLSHKGADKPLIREFKQTLAQLGFDPWLDEDAMHAGVELERGILKGFKESCAAVFFITPNFRDESFLASEVNYAIAEKRNKGDRFAIITIVLGFGGVVPDLLRPYVWKEPKGELKALREIVRALPVALGSTYWR